MPLAQTDGQPGEHCHLDFKAIFVRSVHEYVLRFIDPASVFIIDVLMSDTKRHTLVANEWPSTWCDSSEAFASVNAFLQVDHLSVPRTCLRLSELKRRGVPRRLKRKKKKREREREREREGVEKVVRIR